MTVRYIKPIIQSKNTWKSSEKFGERLPRIRSLPLYKASIFLHGISGIHWHRSLCQLCRPCACRNFRKKILWLKFSIPELFFFISMVKKKNKNKIWVLALALNLIYLKMLYLNEKGLISKERESNIKTWTTHPPWPLPSCLSSSVKLLISR